MTEHVWYSPELDKIWINNWSDFYGGLYEIEHLKVNDRYLFYYIGEL